MNLTVGELIDKLEDFPKDLEITTEICMLWNYPDELLHDSSDLRSDEFEKKSKSEAYELLIFEGSWESGNISDINGILKDHLKILDEEEMNK